ncbi:MAG: nucleotide exchange factor GrpE [Chthoniobacterales bacterium]|nr:nucleotide exchange factor GrpE [Chthoniobacterales bacterium]
MTRHHEPDPKPDTAEPAPGADGGADLSAELDKFRDLALRTAADFDNYRKRAAREKEDAIRYANTSLLENLLPLFDNFELGLEAARSAPDAAAILQGLDMVRRQFQDFLASVGVEEIKTDNAEFDPNLMEAVGHEPDDKTPEGHVLRQTRRGYKLRDRLLRPASVFVSKGPAS